MTNRVSLWLLASIGVVVGHMLGYGAAHADDADRALALAGHGYLGPVTTVVIPLGLAAMLAVAIQTVRRGGPGAIPDVRRLALLQVALFTAQEVLERIPGPGAPIDVLTERSVWFGLAAQVLVAIAVVRLVRGTAAIVRAVAAGAPPRRIITAAGRQTVAFAVPVVVVDHVARHHRRRGPPERTVTRLSV